MEPTIGDSPKVARQTEKHSKKSKKGHVRLEEETEVAQNNHDLESGHCASSGNSSSEAASHGTSTYRGEHNESNDLIIENHFENPPRHQSSMTAKLKVIRQRWRRRPDNPEGVPDCAMSSDREGVWYRYIPVNGVLSDPHWVWWFIQVIGCVGLATTALVAAVLSYGASWYPIGIAVVSLVLVLDIGLYAEWAYRRHSLVNVYIHLCILYVSNVALLMLSTYALMSIPLGQQYFTENWWYVQTKVIAFTTLLDAKQGFKSVTTLMMVFGTIMTIANTGAIGRAWFALGGMESMIRHGLRMMAPQLIVILATSAIAAGLYIDSAAVCQHARPMGEDDLFVGAATSLMVVMGVIVLGILALRWGNHHLTFSAHFVFFTLFGIMLLVASCVVSSRSNDVTFYVRDHWSTIQNFVPADFADKSYHKYGLECSTLLDQAAIMGIMSALLTLFYALSALRAAFVSIALGEGGFDALIDAHIERSQSVVRRSVTTGSSYGAMDESIDDAVAAHAHRSAITSDLSLHHPLQSKNADTWGRALEVDQNPSSPMLNAASSPKRRTHAESDVSSITSERYGDQWNSNLPFKTASAGMGPSTVLYRDEHSASSLLAKHPFPSMKEWAKTSLSDITVMVRDYKWFTLVLALMMIAACIAVGIGMENLEHQLECSALSRDALYSEFNISVPVQQSSEFHFRHTFPHGTFEISDLAATKFGENVPENTGIVVVRQWTLSGRSMYTKDEFETLYQATAGCSDSTAGACNVTLAAEPTETQKRRTKSECDAIQIIMYIPLTKGDASRSKYDVFSEKAFVNFTSSIPLSTLLLGAIIDEVHIETKEAPILLTAALVQRAFASPLNNADDVNVDIKSGSGDVTVNGVLGHGFDLETGGDLFLQTAISFDMNKQPFMQCLFRGEICIPLEGDITMKARGTGRALVSAGCGGDNLFVSSEQGTILAQNSIALIVFETRFEATIGDIRLTSWLQGAGNYTVARTVGDITVSVLYANFFEAESYEGGVSVVELFLGVSPPDPDVYLPAGTPAFNYTTPGTSIRTHKGALTLLGIGAAPNLDGLSGGSNWAADMQIELISDDGDVKVQVNGGGYTGPYDVSSEYGAVDVEVNGRTASSSGTIDANSKGIGKAIIRTTRGDAEFVVLPSPLGAVLF